MAFLDITQSSSTKLLIRNIFKRQIRSSFLCALHPANRGFYEITVLGPSFIGCVDQVNTFCKSFCLIFFQLFWWSYIILTSKKWQPNFSKVFRKFVILFSLKLSERRIIVILDFSFQIPCLAKLQFLSYCPKCSVVIRFWRIPEILVSHESVELWRWFFLQVSHKSTGLGPTWLGMVRLIQNYTSETHSEDGYGQNSFVYWTPINRGS